MVSTNTCGVVVFHEQKLNNLLLSKGVSLYAVVLLRNACQLMFRLWEARDSCNSMSPANPFRALMAQLTQITHRTSSQ